ncbi:hypothetical protein [Actinomadura alba]|uniref:Uncharacterized protein n=1 Tax=Actinomadura alba TaxID=406431 RepID=A0ABR7LSF3_9ACTN|nr:hypothetical protein [Actinomadura alba]MBC6467779.1 hypothetical protein [Actinomadura alba]
MSEAIQTIESAAGTLALRSVEISLTYGGYLEGMPSRKLNDEHLRRQVERVRGLWRHIPVHLVEPVRTVADDREPHPRWGPMELMPPLECVGLFHGRPTPRAVGDWMYTALVVIWYQEIGDGVIHPTAMARLGHLPWAELARDFSYDDL